MSTGFVRAVWAAARLLPNTLTVVSLCVGVIAIFEAVDNRFENSVIAILISAILDGIDGRMAVLLKVQSQFGKEIDGLSDMICFGIAPAMVIYYWVLAKLGVLGIAVTLIYVICCALRLARFAVIADGEGPIWAKTFMIGIPASPAANLVLAPLIAGFEIDVTGPALGPLVALLLVIAGGLMVSRIPTFAPKAIRLPRPMRGAALLFVGICAIAVVVAPWWALLANAVVYLCSIPITMFLARRMVERSVVDLQGLHP